MLRLCVVQSHSLLQDTIWDYDGYDVEKYHSDKEYQEELYKEQAQSIKAFHQELVNEEYEIELNIKGSISKKQKEKRKNSKQSQQPKKKSRKSNM